MIELTVAVVLGQLYRHTADDFRIDLIVRVQLLNGQVQALECLILNVELLLPILGRLSRSLD